MPAKITLRTSREFVKSGKVIEGLASYVFFHVIRLRAELEFVGHELRQVVFSFAVYLYNNN